MTTGRFLAFCATTTLLAGALFVVPAAQLTARNDSPYANFGERLLKAHNQERARVGAVPLRWDADLAADAKQWADHLAKRGRMEHASYEQRKKAGENLWMGSAGYYSAETMIGGFIEERKYLLKNGSISGPANFQTFRVRDGGRMWPIIPN